MKRHIGTLPRCLLSLAAVAVAVCFQATTDYTSALAQEVRLPASIAGEPGTFITVRAETTDEFVRWKSLDNGLAMFPSELLRDTKTAVVVAMKAGRYRLIAVSAKDGVPSDFAETMLVIGNAPPGPGPTPPDPGPEPTPDPQPGPSPIAAEGFRVLILHETEPLQPLTEAQSAVLTSPQVIGYLQQRTVKESNNQPSYRVWDDDYSDEELVNAPQFWRDAYRQAVKLKKDDQRWIVISNTAKKKWQQGPLPDNVADLMTLLKTYGD